MAKYRVAELQGYADALPGIRVTSPVRWTGFGCRVAVGASLLWVVAGAGCGGGDGGNPIGPLPVSANVSMAPAQYGLFSGSQIAGKVRFPAADASGAQYLVVGQFATGVPDVKASVAVSVGAASSASVMTGLPFATATSSAPDVATRFHDLLRMREAEFARAAATGFAPRAAPRSTQAPPALGSTRTFKVCANLQCTSLANVPATVKTVGTRAVIYVDDSVPAGGFSQGDLDNLGAEFDATLYPLDHATFGAESDIDANGVVIILLTRKINALVPKPDCQTAFVTGFFYGADIAPGLAGSHNNGEVFYGFVPDPSGTVSCAYSTTFIRRLLPVTFIHEFQHMISFNQHVLVRGGNTEVLWLNEAMSHLAEELGGLHYDSLGQDTTASRFLLGDLYNGFIYLKNPNGNVLVSDSPPGSLQSRGGEWLLLRYVVDRFGTGAIASLEQTSSTGDANIAAVTGVPFATLLGRWALAAYASDLPGFTAPADLRYATWSFRATYASLNSQQPSTFDRAFPLTPLAGTPGGFAFGGSLTSGSGAYLLITQPANGGTFDVTFRTSTGAALPSNAAGQLAVLRIR